MLNDEKMQLVKTLGKGTELASESDDVVLAYLQLAEDELLNHLYPYGHEKVKLEDRYATKQVRLAIIMYNEKGVEGQVAHSENGVKRDYLTKEQFLASIPRHCGIPK